MLLLSAGFCPASFQKDTSAFNGNVGSPVSGLTLDEVNGKPLMAVSDGTVGDALKGAYAEYQIGDYLYGNVGDRDAQVVHNNRLPGKIVGSLLAGGGIAKATGTVVQATKAATLARLTKAPPKVKGSGVVQTVGRFGGELPDTGKLVQLDEYLEYGVVDAKRVSPEMKALAEANITDNGITVLGKFQAPPGQMNYIQKATTGKYSGSSYFDLGSAWTPVEGKAANLHFLDIVGGKGDKIIFSIPKNKISAGTSLDMEVQYLKENLGYKWVNQWSMQKKSL